MCFCTKAKHRMLLTPIIALSSGIVTCFARSTACNTCCWCSGCKHGRSWFINALSRFAISVWNESMHKVEKSEMILYNELFPRIDEPHCLVFFERFRFKFLGDSGRFKGGENLCSLKLTIYRRNYLLPLHSTQYFMDISFHWIFICAFEPFGGDARRRAPRNNGNLKPACECVRAAAQQWDFIMSIGCMEMKVRLFSQKEQREPIHERFFIFLSFRGWKLRWRRSLLLLWFRNGERKKKGKTKASTRIL